MLEAKENNFMASPAAMETATFNEAPFRPLSIHNTPFQNTSNTLFRSPMAVRSKGNFEN
jgi:hypothetical protein